MQLKLKIVCIFALTIKNKYWFFIWWTASSSQIKNKTQKKKGNVRKLWQRQLGRPSFCLVVTSLLITMLAAFCFLWAKVLAKRKGTARGIVERKEAES